LPNREHAPGAIVAAEGLSELQLEAINQLEKACAGDGRLKLEWSTLRSRPNDQVRDFLFVSGTDGRLIGFLGLYNFGAGLTEICGMVHPDHRRQGVFTRLLDAAEAHVLTYESRLGDGRLERLLVVNRESEAGQAFALARGGVLEHSEYELVRAGVETDLASFHRYGELVVRPARESDRPVFSAILASAFSTGEGVPLEEVAIGGVTAIEWRAAPVGMLRAEVSASGAWVSGFAIGQEYRGRGFGHQALATVVEGLERSGVKRVSLDVATNNARALKLYTDLGFEQVGAMDYYVYGFTAGSTTNATRQ
jgi:ribosomal protein S18 acetylase RimI-like enzyme